MDVFKTLILDTPVVEGATGTVTSVDLTAGTGISVSGGPITTSGSITVTNTSPDQTVSIAAGTGISVTGSYPSFTVTNSSPSLGGDVVGPASATDNAVVRFDSTTGKLIQNSGVSISDANLLTTTALTVNDNTTLGSSNTDTVNFNARVASDINPATDNTYDLGVTGHEWRNLNIDGTANIDSLVADTADINGGTIDATAIGGNTAAAGAFTTLSATGNISYSGAINGGFTVSDGTLIGLAYVSSHGTRSMVVGTTTNHSVYIFQNNAERAVFSSTGLAVTGALSSTTGANFATSSGNVGIGTASPGSKLDVNGELRIGNTVATAVAVASTHKVTIVIGGVTYYLLATNV